MFGIGFWEIIILAVVIGVPFTLIAVVMTVLLLNKRRVP